MRRTILALGALLTILTGCLDFGDSTGPSSTSVAQTGPIYVGATPAPSPSPSAAPGTCGSQPSQPVARVRFGIREGSCSVPADRGCATVALAVGERVQFDLTPLAQDDTPVACHGPVALEVQPAAGPCDLRSGGGLDFLPVVVGASTGSCRIVATVNGGSGQVTVDVR